LLKKISYLSKIIGVIIIFNLVNITNNFNITVVDNNSYILHIINRIMKVNRKVSDLARKLDYIGMDFILRRGIIVTCMNSENKTTYRIVSLRRQIEKSYQEIKKAREDFVEEYNSPIIEKDFIYLN
jgi:hypothetical protein